MMYFTHRAKKLVMATVQLPPDLLLYIEAIKPSLNVLTVCAVWLGISIPLMFLLTKAKPLFIFNAVSIFIGIAMGVLNMVILLKTLGDPLNGISKPVYVTYLCLTVSVELFIDSILLFRVVSVFPVATTSTNKLVLIFGPLIVLKIGRTVDILIFLSKFVKKTLHLRAVQSDLALVAKNMPEDIIGWALQLVDNGLCSAIFLWKLREARTLSGRFYGSEEKLKYTYASKLRDLFWIATSNFVFPAFFNISLLALVSAKTGNPTNYWIVMICSIYVEIIGVLFATIWVTGREDSASSKDLSMSPMHAMQFAVNPSLPTPAQGKREAFREA
ncbi:hypothetical protein BDQ17DRAFT_1345237 [Cyathus striatus]|nr:hypothetical protein BDQ17DRAFT_1345237 [Cyathus striatus]